MGNLSAVEVLQEQKSNPLTQTLPLVVVTSSRENPDINKAYELVENSYIVKPVNFDDFLKAISQIGLYWLLVNEAPK